ncbi:MAG: BtpA/SgcQ family protein [Actinobacteria bacterium]|nr:BtpA/SgcQ family protein [Actinomycetota bacterium]
MSELLTDGLPKTNDLQRIFGRRFALIGMLHLLPLPGTPHYDPRVGVTGLIDRAKNEAAALLDAGFDGLILENGWDIPFVKPSDLGPETPAVMAVVLAELRREFDVPFGVNVLANAAAVSLAVAQAAGGSFVRANQWANAYVANEGFLEGKAGQVLRYRHNLGADAISVWADVHVKLGAHAITADRSIADQTRDAAWFDADAVIVTGTRLGSEPTQDELVEIREATSLALVLGSGVRSDNLAALAAHTDGAIIGSSIKAGGVWHGPIDTDACRAIAAARDAVEG